MHTKSQAPPVQIATAFAGGVQVTQAAPHWVVLEFGTQAPLQAW